MVYANWVFYNRVWHGELTAQEFERWSTRASLEMDRVTNGKAAGAPDTMTDALAQCCCELAEAMWQQDQAASASCGGAVASENVDGYSVTYRESSGGLDAAAENTRLNIYRKYLCCPVNLMYTGVRW